MATTTVSRDHVRTRTPLLQSARRFSSRLFGHWNFTRIFIIATISVGVAIFVYPVAANWFADRNHASQVHSYASGANMLTADERDAMLEAALEYNQNLPNGPLRDPYALDENGNPVPIGDGKEVYDSLLNIGPQGVMGTLQIPKIRVSLPIFHDTDDKSLDAGVGHFYGSGLPVGGEGTHSVLTAHSGVVGARLFTDLQDLEMGDTFSIRVLNEVFTYEVDQIVTVVPDDLGALRQIPGEDHVTLVTCTPIGINTHRLLVRGERVPTPEAEKAAMLDADDASPGFPWWPYPVPATALLLAFATRGMGPRVGNVFGGTAESDEPTSIQFTFRRKGSRALQAWKKRHAFLVDEAQSFRTSSDRLRGADVDRFVGSGEPGVFTWSLMQGDDRVGVSAFAFSTLDAAREDAEWATSINTSAGIRIERFRRLSHWVVGVSGVAVVMSLSPQRSRSAALNMANAVNRMLARAEISQVDPQSHNGDESQASITGSHGTREDQS